MKKHLQFALMGFTLLIILTGLLYGLFAFSLWESNPKLWSEETRVAISCIEVIVIYVSTAFPALYVYNK